MTRHVRRRDNVNRGDCHEPANSPGELRHVCFSFLPVRQPPGRCRRHAPLPGRDPFEVAHWPNVRPNDRCGSGAAVMDGTGPGIVWCRSCAHWLQPNGEPVRPDYRQGLSADWWVREWLLHPPRAVTFHQRGSAHSAGRSRTRPMAVAMETRRDNARETQPVGCNGL